MEFLKMWVIFAVIFAVLLIPFLGLNAVWELAAGAAILGIFATLLYTPYDRRL